MGLQALTGQQVIDGNLTLTAQTTTPPVPTGGAARLYMTGGTLVMQYNQDGTPYYKTLDLAGTTGVWTHGTAAP